jgi:hypothetical protein
MDPEPAPATGGDLLETVRVLLVVQAAVAALNTVEAVAVALLGNPVLLAGPVPLSAATAALLLALAGGVAGHARWARRITLAVESLLLLLAAADQVLAALLHRAAPLPVPLLVRVVLPLAVLVLLERPAAQAAFAAHRAAPADDPAGGGGPVAPAGTGRSAGVGR